MIEIKSGAPNENIIAKKAINAKSCKASSTPYIRKNITLEMIIQISELAVLNVTFSGTANEEIFGAMPNLSVHNSIIDGMIAPELAVAKAGGMSAGTFFRNGFGDIFPTCRMKIGQKTGSNVAAIISPISNFEMSITVWAAVSSAKCIIAKKTIGGIKNINNDSILKKILFRSSSNSFK